MKSPKLHTSDIILYNGIILAFILDFLFVFNLHIFSALRVFLGVLILGCSWGLIYVAKKEFKIHMQKSAPGNTISTLIDTGVYARTRNPIYVGVVGVSIACAFIFNSGWFIFSAFVIYRALTRSLIEPEEKYLHTVFGDTYTAYTKKVKRWL